MLQQLKIIENLCTDNCINKSFVIDPLKYAIKNLLKRYKELEENNKELKKYYASRKEVEDLKETIACLHESSKEYIHISVIQNKLIEAEHYIECVDVKEGQAMYKVLQELLEEGNK